MLQQIRKSVDREVDHYAEAFKRPPMSALPERYREVIEAFIRRKGKRIRSVLFVVGYRAYSSRRVRHLYRSAAALELLHDFILIHDDLIDHASTRRGEASMHASLEAQLRQTAEGRRFKGGDLALIVGDMLYAMAIQGFMAIQESPDRKQRALAQLTETALYTGCGELEELLHTLRPLEGMDAESIYRIYDWKTGHYTFSAPLAMGATLAGVGQREVDRLLEIGRDLGRAYQIKDDLMDLFGAGDRFGKPGLIDLREGKKTLMVWRAYHQSSPAARRMLERVLGMPKPGKADVLRASEIVVASGAPDYAEAQMQFLLDRALAGLKKTRMSPEMRGFVGSFASELLEPPTRIGA